MMAFGFSEAVNAAIEAEAQEAAAASVDGVPYGYIEGLENRIGRPATAEERSAVADRTYAIVGSD